MSLINFRKHDFSNDVPVIDNVMFNSSKWRIQWAQSEHIVLDFERVRLEGTRLIDHPELDRFAKIMTYYAFPKKIRLTITSWSTTKLHHGAVLNFIKNFCWPNQLLSAKMLSSVTQQQLQNHFNTIVERLESGVSGSLTAFASFLHFIKDWSDLTRRKLLPKEYNLDVNIELILTKDVMSRCRQLIDEQTDTWQPLPPEYIEVTYKEAHRYLYEYAPCIIECQDLIRKRPTVGIVSKNLGAVRKDGRSKELFEILLNKDVPMIDSETKLFNFVPTTKKVKSKGYARGWQYRTTLDITEVRPEVIKLKRACVFLIGLFTGMRRREIAELRAKPAFKKNRDWYLAITRFKTSDDASGIGEPDLIPVPDIVRDAIDVLIKLFKNNREQMGSDYLMVSDIMTRKKFEKIKINTVGKDIRKFIFNTAGISAHSHQLRKTLAWLLISRSEHNIELIRQLFGHKSYGMTLRYILRNELIVASVMELLEHNYTEDLNDVFQSIANGETAGDLSNRIKERMDQQQYKGQILVTDIESFIHEALQAGVPIFVSRLPIGAFCIKAGDTDTLPPCMKKSKAHTPQVEFCDYKKCSHVLHNDESVANIGAQIVYYQKKQKNLPEDLNERVVSYYETQVIEHQELLERLNRNTTSVVMEEIVHA
ncbi:site-specific integrase [Shewanella sp. 10N.261.52.F9]|uniref:site-specific integrase n=1 Tax=Shewanella sp. 10N.261.52.F9 TaxID=3229684 RepID=UPI003553C39C